MTTQKTLNRIELIIADKTAFSIPSIIEIHFTRRYYATIQFFLVSSFFSYLQNDFHLEQLDSVTKNIFRIILESINTLMFIIIIVYY